MEKKIFEKVIFEILVTSSASIETTFIDGSPGASEGFDEETQA